MPVSRKKRKVRKVMEEYKRGTLKSGGRRKVKSRRQAVAIAMSESGQSRNRRKTAKRGAPRKAGRKTAKTAPRKTARGKARKS